MKRLSLTLLALAVTPTFVLIQSNDEQPVRQTLDQIATALRANNANALDKLYADDYNFVSPQGIMVTKPQRLETMRSGQLKYESFYYEDAKVHVYGNAAVTNTTVKVKLRGRRMQQPPLPHLR